MSAISQEKSTFFVVKHEFKAGQSAAFWKWWADAAKDPAAMAEYTKAQDEAGFHNHSAMPTATEGPVFCLWEARADKTPEDFQDFIDSEESPGNEKYFCNICYALNTTLTGGQTPYPRFYEESESKSPEAADVPQAPKEPVDSKSSFFMIEHFFKPGKAEEWWKNISQLMGDQAAWADMVSTHIDNGFFNHTFFPSGQTEPAFCIWEGKDNKTLEEMQEFIDGRHGPGQGALLNVVRPIETPLVGGITPFVPKF